MAVTSQSFDAVIVGAGFSGMYMLKLLRDRLGLTVRVYEAGETVGGTWYWNRYPGARCDSDSYIYCYTWDKQLLQEWEWSERYPEQCEILSYLEHVAKRHDLKRDIEFNTRVTSGEFDDTTNMWRLRTDKGDEITARYLIAAVGSLSAENMPRFKGLKKFKGRWYHTSRFPHGGVDFTNKRVAVVGTGATGVQVIPEVSQQAKPRRRCETSANSQSRSLSTAACLHEQACGHDRHGCHRRAGHSRSLAAGEAAPTLRETSANSQSRSLSTAAFYMSGTTMKRDASSLQAATHLQLVERAFFSVVFDIFWKSEFDRRLAMENLRDPLLSQRAPYFRETSPCSAH